MSHKRIGGFILGVIFGVFLGMGIVAMPHARADGFIDSAEMDYANRWADQICSAIDASPTEETVMRIAMIMMDEGYEPDSAADIVNYSVGEWCPRNGPLLNRIGAAHRAQSGALT